MPERAARLVLAFLVSVPSLGEAAFQAPAPIARRDTYRVGGVTLGVQAGRLR